MSFNLQEEVIDGHLVTAETKKLWAVEMDIAQKLLDVCQKYNLKIWAAAGTMLGAVRHKGFIPWDDDMDFCMMREDYKKLIEIGPKEFEYPYFFQSFYTDAHAWEYLVKIRRSDTAAIEASYQFHKEFNRGIFVDILVLDGVPQDKDDFRKLYRNVGIINRLLHNYRMLNPRYYSKMVKIRHALIYAYVVIRNPYRLREKIEQLFLKNPINDVDLCGAIEFHASVGTDIKKIKISNKHCYDETVLLPFHDMLIPVPKGYDKLLTDIYGDYMKPVKGGASHSLIVVDCDRSYKDIMKELLNNK